VAEKGRLFTGARARFSIGGVKVGYATNVTVSEDINYEDIECLDNIEVEEQVPTGYRVSMSARFFRIIGDTLKSRGWFPSVGSNSEDHLKNILTSGDLSATIEDTKTGKLFATVEQVKIAGHNWTVDARGVVGEDMTMKAIRCKDESET
jgi:hypothetical protein